MLPFQLSDGAQSRDATVVEASVPVHRQMASSTLLVAGDSETIETWSSLLQCIPACFQHQEQGQESTAEHELKTVHCGDEPGAAGRAQLCVSHLISIQMLGWLETRSLAARLGLAGGSVDALIGQIPKPTLGSTNVTVEMMESQLRDAVESARKVQAPVPVGALAAQIYGMVGTGGYIDLDYSVVDQAVYAIAKPETAEQQDPVALSVDTIQQSLDVSQRMPRCRCPRFLLRTSICMRYSER